LGKVRVSTSLAQLGTGWPPKSAEWQEDTVNEARKRLIRGLTPHTGVSEPSPHDFTTVLTLPQVTLAQFFASSETQYYVATLFLGS
jgi:hypothetical protein